ncbi:MAG: hypothetical protein HY266_10180 [Deltaproteobacteria bacterium]|nr:hypothetical protein [Deltaproteobacteria bacterium]
MGKHTLPMFFLALGVIVFLGLFFAISGHISWSKNGDCRDCHSGAKAKELGLDDVYAKVASLKYKHSVVEDEKCEQCHILKGFKTGRTWELASSELQREQIFFLKSLLWDRKYSVDLKIKDGAGKEVLVTNVQVKPSQISNIVDNDLKEPLIKDVFIEGIRQAVFLEATIGWETDKPSNSIVEYGLTPQYGEISVSEKIFANGHRITIAGLKPKKLYHYRVKSRDIFGNTGVSPDFVLDTSAQVGSRGNDAEIDTMRPQIKKVAFFKTHGTQDIFLKLSSDKPVKAYLTINEPAEIDKHGFGLVPARVSRIDACVKCHAQGISHPVGIRSNGPKTKIPAELPTIEGGVITCVTCHYPHGGNKKYFARLDFERDLCLACHTTGSFL